MENMQQIKVLMVEDSQYAADINARQIKKSGLGIEYQVVSDKQAMEKALQGKEWDLILSDNCMPWFSGLGALEVRNRLGANTPFILLSEHMMQEEIAMAYGQGLTAFICKCDLMVLGVYLKKLFLRGNGHTRNDL